jgi:hypothetical protein
MAVPHGSDDGANYACVRARKCVCAREVDVHVSQRYHHVRMQMVV